MKRHQQRHVARRRLRYARYDQPQRVPDWIMVTMGPLAVATERALNRLAFSAYGILRQPAARTAEQQRTGDA